MKVYDFQRIKLLILENLTTRQREALSNGCGRKGGLVPVPDFCFKSACDDHDCRYWLGYTELHRDIADNLFYAALKKAARDLSWWMWWRIPQRLLLARAYYRAVQAGGWLAFSYLDRPRTWDDVASAATEEPHE